MLPGQRSPRARTRPRRGRRILVALAAACLTALPGHAETRFAASPSPAFPSPQKGRALVYLLRPIWVLGTLPPLELYDEGQIWGYLPVRSYIAVQFEPGERTFPLGPAGPSAGGATAGSHEMFLVAGRTYVLRLDEWRDATGTLQSRWSDMALTDLPGFVSGKKLQYVTLTDEGRAALEKARAELVAARKKAN